jgi:phage-related protein
MGVRGSVVKPSGEQDEPVRDLLRALDDEICTIIGKDILKVQWRWPISRPFVGAFGEGLYEVRSAHDGNIYRVFFCIEGRSMVLLHGFMKKTQATLETLSRVAHALGLGLKVSLARGPSRGPRASLRKTG